MIKTTIFTQLLKDEGVILSEEEILEVIKFFEETTFGEDEMRTVLCRPLIVMKALQVEISDALKIVKHLCDNECDGWIDSYREENRSNEPLIDVHYESDFEDMIDWKFDEAKPSEMLGKSSDIKDYPEMLELEDNVIFWYGLA